MNFHVKILGRLLQGQKLQFDASMIALQVHIVELALHVLKMRSQRWHLKWNPKW